MSRRWLLGISILAALALAAPAAADSSMSITATGTGSVRVLPHNRKSDASIGAAYAAARRASVPAAFVQAHVLALRYARAAGLTIGSIVAVSDAQSQNGPFFSGPGPFFGPFGPGRFCHVFPAGKQIRFGPGNKKTVVKVKRHRTCFVPPFGSTTLMVTYSATAAP